MRGLGDNGDDMYDVYYSGDYADAMYDPATYLDPITEQDAAQFTILDDGTTVDAYARTVTTPDGVVYGDNTVSFLPGAAQSVINSVVNQLTAQAGTAAGRWLSKQVGGSTVLYRQNTGQVGTFNIKALMVPAAIAAGIFLLGKG